LDSTDDIICDPFRFKLTFYGYTQKVQETAQTSKDVTLKFIDKQSQSLVKKCGWMKLMMLHVT